MYTKGATKMAQSAWATLSEEEQEKIVDEVNDVFTGLYINRQAEILWAWANRPDGRVEAKNMLLVHIPMGVGSAINVPEREQILKQAAFTVLQMRMLQTRKKEEAVVPANPVAAIPT